MVKKTATMTTIRRMVRGAYFKIYKTAHTPLRYFKTIVCCAFTNYVQWGWFSPVTLFSRSALPLSVCCVSLLCFEIFRIASISPAFMCIRSPYINMHFVQFYQFLDDCWSENVINTKRWAGNGEDAIRMEESFMGDKSEWEKWTGEANKAWMKREINDTD